MTDTDAGVLVFEGGHWLPAPSPGGKHTRVGNVWRYVPNVIGYVRIAMCLVAGATIVTAHPLVTASLLLGSILLDWVDGPAAGRLHQRSVLGSGVDWLADLMAYVVILAWFVRLEPRWAGLVLAVTAIELAAGLLDFASWPSSAPTTTSG